MEPRPSRLSPRGRTTSTASTASTQSSYAVISDPEFSSSFAASLEAGLVSGSELEDTVISSPALSSPISSSADERLGLPPDTRPLRRSPLAASPPEQLPQTIPHASSFSSLESLHTGSGRLLTLHLEKADSIIWPSLITGPVPECVSPPPTGVYPWLLDISSEMPYNMDSTSLVLIALDLHDIRNAKEDAFEYFVYVHVAISALFPRLNNPTLLSLSQPGLAPSPAPLRSHPPRNPLPPTHNHSAR